MTLTYHEQLQQQHQQKQHALDPLSEEPVGEPGGVESQRSSALGTAQSLLLSIFAFDISSVLVFRQPFGLPVPVPVSSALLPPVSGPGPVKDDVRLFLICESFSGPVDAGPREDTLLIWKEK